MLPSGWKDFVNDELCFTIIGTLAEHLTYGFESLLNFGPKNGSTVFHRNIGI